MLTTLEKTYRSFFPKRLKQASVYLSALKKLCGIEIGGPSHAFTSKGFLPIYSVIEGLDGCNFSSSTVWEGNISEGNHYKFENKTGYQYIADGINLGMIKDQQYDFVLSCHSIEHIANPIKALLEWKRIIKNEGFMVLVVPHKDQTFDNKRPVTTLKHLIQDFEKNVTEEDTTHFEEVIHLHDLSKDPGISSKEELIQRTHNNIHNRCVHHHVFNAPLVAELTNEAGFKICHIGHFNPFNIVMLLQKTNNPIDNSIFLNWENPVYQNPKFPSDKIG